MLKQRPQNTALFVGGILCPSKVHRHNYKIWNQIFFSLQEKTQKLDLLKNFDAGKKKMEKKEDMSSPKCMQPHL